MTAALSVAAACLAAGVAIWASACVLVLVIGLHCAFIGARYRSLPCHASRRIACSELTKSRERVAAIERKMNSIRLEIGRLRGTAAQAQVAIQAVAHAIPGNR